jgi:hypothetical protein
LNQLARSEGNNIRPKGLSVIFRKSDINEINEKDEQKPIKNEYIFSDLSLISLKDR